jgi:hypothetical protein
MKIGLVGYPGSGKSTVFGALTGQEVATGYGSAKANLGTVKVPDDRVDALAAMFTPKKTTYAEVTFSDLAGGHGDTIDRTMLNAMREVDALCQVVRAFPDEAGDPPRPADEILGLELETILADIEIIERRIERLAKDRSNPRELEVQQKLLAHLEAEKPLRSLELADVERKLLSGFRFLSTKPLLLVLNVTEDQAAADADPALAELAAERGLGLIVLSAQVEMEIAQMEPGDQAEFLESLGLEAPARARFLRAAFELLELISMLTYGEDECRAWPVRRGTAAPRAAGKIHSDIERGFIRAEVVRWEDLVRLGSEAKCREAGVLRVEGKEYIVCDGDAVHFRFNV